jgi:hypothetical protein
MMSSSTRRWARLRSVRRGIRRGVDEGASAVAVGGARPIAARFSTLAEAIGFDAQKVIAAIARK